MEDNSNIISTNFLNRNSDISEVKSSKNGKKIKKHRPTKFSKRIRVKDDIKKNKDDEVVNINTNSINFIHSYILIIIIKLLNIKFI